MVPRKIVEGEQPEVCEAWKEFNKAGKVELLWRDYGDERVCMRTDNKELVALRDSDGKLIYR